MRANKPTPELKEVKPINFLFHRAEVTVDQLGDVINVAKGLFKEAVDKNLHITGPIHWHYFGFMGDVTKSFTLEIALPVSHVLSEYDGPFHFKRTAPFKSVSMIHEGSWSELPKSYGAMMSFIEEHHLKPLAVNREVYVNADFDFPEANVTEIQVGVE